jgi:hypothetical protein
MQMSPREVDKVERNRFWLKFERQPWQRVSWLRSVVVDLRLFMQVRGGVDKSLARPTSRCRRTESIVSLERGVCSCAELQVFFRYRGWKEACQTASAISTKSRYELSWSPHPLSPSLQRKAPKEFHSILIETLGEHATYLRANLERPPAGFRQNQ